MFRTLLITAVALASVSVLNGWKSDDKCTDDFIAKIRACEAACEPNKEVDDEEDEDLYPKCLWIGLQEAPLMRSYAADCKLTTNAYNKDCYTTIRRRIFFDCSLSKKINVTATCDVNYGHTF